MGCTNTGQTRKQTLANAERYITPELKEYEEKITGAEEKILQIELDLYEKLLAELEDFIHPIKQNAQVLAILDCVPTRRLRAIAPSLPPVIPDWLGLRKHLLAVLNYCN